MEKVQLEIAGGSESSSPIETATASDEVRCEENMFTRISVTNDGNCLFWAVSITYLLPVKNNRSLFGERFEHLFGVKDKPLMTHVQNLIANDFILANVYEDRALTELVTKLFRNRVFEEMRKPEASACQSVSINDFLRMKNEAFITDGTFADQFKTQFKTRTHLVDLSKLKPAQLNEETIELLNGELDKVLSNDKIQEFIFSCYLDAMKSFNCWAGDHEIKVIETLLKSRILVFTNENNACNINKNDANIFLFNTNEALYEIGLIKAEFVTKALKDEKYELAIDYIDLGVDEINFQDENGDSLLHYAALTDNYNDVISKLIGHGADANIRNSRNKTPADVAKDLNLKKSISAFDLHRKNMDRPIQSLVLNDDVRYNEDGHTVLHVAAEEGNDGIAQLLLANSDLLMVPTQNDRKQTALHLAVKKNHLKVVKRLIESGADVNAKDYCITIKDKDVNDPAFSNWSPLHYAAEKGYLEIVKALVEEGKAEVDIRDYSGGTPLQRAVKFGHLVVAEYLIERGANVNLIDKTKVCVLSYAARAGYEDIVRCLIEKGADMTSVDQNGMSPLHHAVKCQQWNALECLVELKADVNSVDKNGKTPLQRVVTAGKWDVVKYLIENGTSIDNCSEKEKFLIFKNIIKSETQYKFSMEIEDHNMKMLESIRAPKKHE